MQGIAAPAHLREDETAKDAVIYRLETMGVSIAVIGHTVAPLDDDTLEALGQINVLIIPVGGGGTLDAMDAASIVRQINPNYVIPTYYDDGQTKYEVPQDKLDKFEKEMGNSNIEHASALKIKPGAIMPANITTYELTRTK